VLNVCAGIGVPLLLAYVYGVVPISLCRSGGCGVSTTDTGGVRIDFDESDVPVETVTNPFAGKTLHIFHVFVCIFRCFCFLCCISDTCGMSEIFLGSICKLYILDLKIFVVADTDLLSSQHRYYYPMSDILITSELTLMSLCVIMVASQVVIHGASWRRTAIVQ